MKKLKLISIMAAFICAGSANAAVWSNFDNSNDFSKRTVKASGQHYKSARLASTSGDNAFIDVQCNNNDDEFKKELRISVMYDDTSNTLTHSYDFDIKANMTHGRQSFSDSSGRKEHEKMIFMLMNEPEITVNYDRGYKKTTFTLGKNLENLAFVLKTCGYEK